MTNYAKRISDEYASGNINSYMAERLAKASEFGMTDYLLDHAIEDAKDASSSGCDSDDKYNLRFFVLNVADDIMDDTFGIKISPSEKQHLCNYIHSNKSDKYKLDDLTDFRILIHKWLCDKHSKKAYPNISGKENRDPVYDRNKWINTIKIVYNLLKEKSLDKDSAINTATFDWEDDERFKFKNWLKYYESGNTEKYNVKTANTKPVDIYDLGLPESMLNPETRSNNIGDAPLSPYKVRKEKTRKEEELERAQLYRIKMKSRIRALKRLLDQYNDILPHQNIELVQDELYTLDKSISKLNAYATLEDCVIRSANKMHRMGFVEGADLLMKIGAEPADKHDSEAPQTDKTVVDALPPAPKTTNVSSVDLIMIIERLEGLTKLLKSRDLIRDLASVDILLNELGLASYFPELGDSQSKLIEAYSYASNRVEGIVSKLRGTGKHNSPSLTQRPIGNTQVPIQQPPPPEQKMNKEELRSKPVGKMQKELPVG